MQQLGFLLGGLCVSWLIARNQHRMTAGFAQARQVQRQVIHRTRADAEFELAAAEYGIPALERAVLLAGEISLDWVSIAQTAIACGRQISQNLAVLDDSDDIHRLAEKAFDQTDDDAAVLLGAGNTKLVEGFLTLSGNGGAVQQRTGGGRKQGKPRK